MRISNFGDPKLILSDLDLDPTCQVIAGSDFDPTLQAFSDPDPFETQLQILYRIQQYVWNF